MSHIVEGNFVMGTTKEGLVHGKVEHVMNEGGTLGTPGSEYALESMPPDNPAMSVRVYEEEDGKWEETAYSIGMMHNDAKKLDTLEGHTMNLNTDSYDNSIGKAYAGCGCATCKKLDVTCKDCPDCGGDMDKAYEDCGCNTCKALNLKCEDCPVCSQNSKSYNSEDEEEDKWDNIEKACWVGYRQQGMKPGRNGGMVPNCVPVSKSEDVEKATSVSVGDHVTFAVPKPPDKTESAHGVVERVERSGKVTLPGTNETVEASSDKPVAVVRVYATAENGNRTKTDRRVVKPFSSLRVLSEPIDNTEKYDDGLDIEKVSAGRLQELADTYNKGKEGNKRITVGALRQVYNRGIGAYRTNPSSVRGSVSSAEQWAMGRVNAFMAGLRGKFPRKPFDLDLFPKGHPRASSKSLFEGFATEVEKPTRVTTLFADTENIKKSADTNKDNGWGGSIFDLSPFKK